MGTHFLDRESVDRIKSQLDGFPLEHISIGDAGESNNCFVGRLMEDQPGELPKVLNRDLSEPILKLFQSQDAYKFLEPFLDRGKTQHIRRCQFNMFGKGSFVGRHLDVDSNPDYKIAVVLQLSDDFEGGEFAVYKDRRSAESSAQVIKPEYGSITISFCAHEHEVREVKRGERISFVAFISNYAGENKRKPVR